MVVCKSAQLIHTLYKIDIEVYIKQGLSKIRDTAVCTKTRPVQVQSTNQVHKELKNRLTF